MGPVRWISPRGGCQPVVNKVMNPRVLCLVFDGLEEIETVAPVDLLRRADVEVIMASVPGTGLVTGRCGIALRADRALEEVVGESFDLLLIPGGPGVADLREAGQAAKLARHYHDAGKPVAAICAAPTVLHDAGLLEGRRYTSHAGVRDELIHSLPGEAVVEDGNLITSQGAGTAVAFGLALVRRLCGPAKEAEVRRGIML